MGFEMDTDELRASGIRLEDMAQAAGDELSALLGVASSEAPWGGSVGGPELGAAYAAVFGAAESAMQHFTEAIEVVGENLQDAANEMNSADDESSWSFESIDWGR